MPDTEGKVYNIVDVIKEECAKDGVVVFVLEEVKIEVPKKEIRQ